MTYCMRTKFHGLIFRFFEWQENLWGINFRGHAWLHGLVGTIVVRFAKYCIAGKLDEFGELPAIPN